MTRDAASLEARELVRLYQRGSEAIRAVDGVSLSIRQGEFVSFTGPSGCGKTTLVNLLGCLENPSSGQLQVAGKTVFGAGKTLSEGSLTLLRREVFGYVFQNFYLIPTLTVRENVALPLAFYRKPGGDGAVVESLLRRLGLEHRMDHLPGQISGGEMQRVAVARALVNSPQILIADEPTGNLDLKRSTEIGEVLQEVNRGGLTVIMVTHNPALARLGGRVVEMLDGRTFEM